MILAQHPDSNASNVILKWACDGNSIRFVPRVEEPVGEEEFAR